MRLIRWIERRPMLGNVILGVVALSLLTALVRLAIHWLP